MTVVFVHGNPETTAIWDPLIAELGRDDTVTLSPPGFGAPVPEGFGATAPEYVEWLVGELEAIGEPVDLVGHDWGGGHVAGVAATRPDLLRSWCIDIAGCFDPDYVWHDLAQTWQSAEGETAVAAMQAVPVEQRAQMYEGLGMTPEAARSCSEALDDAMGRCILALYRSAAQPAMAAAGDRLASASGQRPALVVIATEDHYTGGEALARRTAERVGAAVAVLDGLGHWWMLEDPKRGAAALADFLATVP
jgi:pimeloyl-ACP methyl ester carboxylesterase